MVVYIKAIPSFLIIMKKTHQTVSVFIDTNLKHIKEFLSIYHLKNKIKKVTNGEMFKWYATGPWQIYIFMYILN